MSDAGATTHATAAEPVKRLSPLVSVVLAPNPSPYTLEGTNTYVIGDRATIVIDPGPDDEEHFARVLQLSSVPSVILLTHSHPDHAEGAERFAAISGGPIAAWGGGDPACTGIAGVRDGDVIMSLGSTLRAVHTPGHASDHLSFFLEEERALFTGDHVLGRGTTVVAHPDGDMSDYLASLDRVIALGPARLYPGHGPVVEAPMPVLEYYRSHRIDRERQVLDALAAGDATVEAMVARIYADVDASLHPAAALSVAAHLEKLRRDGRAVAAEGAGWQPA